jgi:hypothetical protein
MGKVAMSVLTKGLAMDWVREGKKDMAITSIWPATASNMSLSVDSAHKLSGNSICRNGAFDEDRS